MTRTEFFALLERNNISSDIVRFESSVSEGYYLLRNYHRYEVFYRERGGDYEHMGFPSESAALEYLANKLISYVK